ncbi:Microtubule-actin cross-linking factor 1 [Geodia barretti]|uniref:Microtubule-actin cross-linking factor 1 n=1 Tax=Geodia barretti TaxID=519541 RepID=A0AA35QVB0_GEOBA|nr:Microtubule-actin cross-linking factor 1 [Geodia barretti]
MVRVGGGWEPLEEFLRKHDPCRATRRTNASLRGMGVGLTTASFATKTQTAISHKNSELRGGGGGGEGDATLTVTELPSGRKTATLPTKRSSSTTIMRPGATGTWSGRGSRESTPTRSPGLSVQATRAEPLRHTLVRQGSPKTTRTGGQARSRTPSRGLSPPTGNGHKTPTSAPTTPSHIPKPARRPISPSSSAHTATGVGPRPSGIPTPSRSKVAKNSPRHK